MMGEKDQSVVFRKHRPAVVAAQTPTWLTKGKGRLDRLSKRLSAIIYAPLASEDDLTALSLESLSPRDNKSKQELVKRRSYKGILFSMVTGLSCAVSTLMSRESRIGPFDVSFTGGIVMTTISAVICLKLRENPLGNGLHDNVCNIVGNVLTAVMWGCQFIAVRNMPYADAVVIGYISPVFGVFLSALILRERPRISDGVTIVLMLVGFVLIAKPTFIFHNVHDDQVYPARGMATVCALAVALCGSGAAISFRKIVADVKPASLVFMFGMGSIVVGVVGAYTIDDGFTYPIPCGWNRLFIILQGVTMLIGQYFFVIAVSIERVPICQILRSTEIVHSYIFQAIFFPVRIDAVQICGALLIVSASVVNGLKHVINQHRQNRH